MRPRRSARSTRDTAVLVLSQYVEDRATRSSCSQESAEGVGYLLKDRVYDLADFVAAVNGWPRAARRSIPTSSRSSSADDAAITRSPS